MYSYNIPSRTPVRDLSGTVLEAGNLTHLTSSNSRLSTERLNGQTTIILLYHTMPQQLLHPFRPTEEDLGAFINRHELLLQNERDAEEEQTRLLNSNCSAKELERKGLSLGGLGVSAISVGLGGKT